MDAGPLSENGTTPHQSICIDKSVPIDAFVPLVLPNMFHIKICGVRRLQDVHAVADSGADAIGLNFFPASVRYLDPESPQATEVSKLARERRLLRVGVFVNESIETIRRIVDLIEIDVVQLHGDESVAMVTSLATRSQLPLIRAVKLPVGPLETASIEASARPWIDAGCHPLLDADAGAAHGGSGKRLDWNSIRRWSEAYPQTDFTLAGGLNPQNVGEAIRQSGAKSVDTASGVEQPRGEKQPDLIDAFVRACHLSGCAGG